MSSRNNYELELTTNTSFDRYIINLKTMRGRVVVKRQPIMEWFVRPESREHGSYTIAYSFNGSAMDVDWGNEVDEPEGSRLYQLAEDSLVRSSLFRRIPATNTIPDLVLRSTQSSPSQPKCTRLDFQEELKKGDVEKRRRMLKEIAHLADHLF